MNDKGRIRWGILGDAGINRALIPGAHSASNAELIAIASRRPGVAKRAAETWNIPRWYGSYEELLADPEIDAVYIPLANHEHATWTIRCADAGKNVLCEKPLAVTVDEVNAIRQAAERNKVRVLEPVTYLFHHHYDHPDDEVFLNKQPEVMEFPLVDPYRLAVEHLGASIANGTELAYGLDDALNNTRALLVVHRSAREGREVPI